MAIICLWLLYLYGYHMSMAIISLRLSYVYVYHMSVFIEETEVHGECAAIF